MSEEQTQTVNLDIYRENQIMLPKAFTEIENGISMKIKENTDNNVNFHKTITVKKLNGDYVVRKAYHPSEKKKIDQILNNILLACRHPICIMQFYGHRYSDRSFGYEEEFTDGLDLCYYIDRIRLQIEDFENKYPDQKERIKNPSYIEFRMQQVQFCKAIVRQLMDYIVWLEDVIRVSPHKNLSPKTILLRRDGFIKVKMFRILSEEIINENPYYFMKNCAFTEPESCESVRERMNVSYSNDVWAVGAIIYSIMTGDNLLPTYDKKNPHCQNNNLNNTEEQIEVSNKNQEKNYKKFMDFIKNSNASQPLDIEMKQWYDLCIDPFLAHFTRKCLTIKKQERLNAKQLLCYIYLAGSGLVKSNNNQPCLSVEDRKNLDCIVNIKKYYERIIDPETKIETGWKSVLDWSQIYDAWSIEIAQLSQTYEKLPLIFENNDVNFGEQIYNVLSEHYQNNSIYINYWRNTFTESQFGFKFPMMADQTENISVPNNPVMMNQYLESLFINNTSLYTIISNENNNQYNIRNCQPLNDNMNKTNKTLIDKQRREVIKGRLSTSRRVLGHCMSCLRNGYSLLPRVSNKIE